MSSLRYLRDKFRAHRSIASGNEVLIHAETFGSLVIIVTDRQVHVAVAESIPGASARIDPYAPIYTRAPRVPRELRPPG